MIAVDGRCFCSGCTARTGDVYRMIGTCTNCGMKPILMIFRLGDLTRTLDCPACGCHRVESQRAANVDEIPIAEEAPHD